MAKTMDTAAVLRVLDLDADADDPPTNDKGEYVCGRECVDGTVCMTPSAVPFWPCANHETNDPLV